MFRGSEKRVAFEIKLIIILINFILKRAITVVYRFNLYPYIKNGLIRF
jgi:hypothetical protein